MDDIFAVSEVRGIDREQLLRGPPNISDNLRLPTLEAKASNKFRVKFSDNQTYYTRLASIDDTINWQGEVDKNHPRFLAKMDGRDFQACLRLAHSLHLWSQSVPGRTLNVVADYSTTEETRAEVRDFIEPYKTSVAGPQGRAEDLPTAKRRRDETHVPGQGQHTSFLQQPAANDTAQGAAPSPQPNAHPEPTESYRDPNAQPQLCANCWTPGHSLKDCTVGDVHTGALPGCPVCNVPGPRPGWTHEQGHHFDDCQKWERTSGSPEETEMGYYRREPRFRMLVWGRARKPAIRSINNFYLDVFMENFATMPAEMENVPAGDVFPWTNKFAIERSGFPHNQNVGVEDPYWAGKTVGNVFYAYGKDTQSLSHLRYISAAQAEEKAKERMVARYALETALKDPRFQMWISKDIQYRGQVYTFRRIKLPSDPGFGELQPVGGVDDGVQVKQEPSEDVAMSDALGQVVTRGHYRPLITINEDGTSSVGVHYSEEHTAHEISPSDATMAHARLTVRQYIGGELQPGTILPLDCWGQALGQLFKEGEKVKMEEARVWDEATSNAFSYPPLPPPDSENL